MQNIPVRFSKQACQPERLSESDRGLLVKASLKLFIRRLNHGIPVLRSDLLNVAYYAPIRGGRRMNHESQRGSEDFARATDQNTQILALLRQAGPRGVTNSEMWAVGAHAAHSRISDLRKRGHEITCKREKPGIWRYTLVSSISERQKPKTPGDWYSREHGARPKNERLEALPLFTEGRP